MKNVENVIVGEATFNDLVIAEKGALRVRLITKEKATHGASPHLGVNAIMKMDKIQNLANTVQP
jgi:succinyl-diaminopimelate desuccinylase